MPGAVRGGEKAKIIQSEQVRGTSLQCTVHDSSSGIQNEISRFELVLEEFVPEDSVHVCWQTVTTRLYAPNAFLRVQTMRERNERMQMTHRGSRSKGS